MDEEREHRIRMRALALWEASGGEPGHELDHWLQAERELEQEEQSVAGEEDPLIGVDEEPPGTFATEAKR